jgi:acyl-CoA thioester hydrolase
MRIKLKKIEHYVFTTQLKIRITDLNYGNHLSNEMILSYAQQARVDFLKALGNWDELNLAGGGMIMSDAAVVYKSEGHAGEELEIQVAVDDLTRVGFDFYYRIIEKVSQREVALAKTGIVCFDYTNKKVAPVPAAFIAALANLK